MNTAPRQALRLFDMRSWLPGRDGADTAGVLGAGPIHVD